MVSRTILIVSGLNDSGPEHWQTFWLRKFPEAKKVIQKDWKNPILSEWIEGLNQAIKTCEGDIIFVAHSLAVSLITHWAENQHNHNVVGAMLVCPADVDSPIHTPDSVRNFAPMPLAKLPFPSVVVASENDGYVSLNRAAFFANQWGGDFINVGNKGHINSDSKLEYWEEGQKILNSLLLKIAK